MSEVTAFHSTRRFLLLGAASFAVSACSGIIGPSGESQIYVLKPQFPKMSGPTVSWGLSIGRPDAPQTLDSNRISISRSPTTMDYYADAVWPDRLTDLIRDFAVAAFEASGRIPSVAADSVGAHADYELEMVVRNFEARYDTADGPPVAVVRFHAKLVTKLKQHIMGDFETAHEAQASVNSVDAAVLAFDQAFGAALAEVVEWTLRTGMPLG
jgi:cholesterol transport system auxiliary component